MANTRTPEQGMEEAARGMTDRQLKSELQRLDKMKDRTLGQEEARKTIQNEIERRGKPVQG